MNFLDHAPGSLPRPGTGARSHGELIFEKFPLLNYLFDCCHKLVQYDRFNWPRLALQTFKFPLLNCFFDRCHKLVRYDRLN